MMYMPEYMHMHKERKDSIMANVIISPSKYSDQ